MNAELIKALRCEVDCGDCAYFRGHSCDIWGMMRDAAAALEADEQRIAELERILKAVQENSGINFRMWQEAEARLPKEGEWIQMNGHRYCNVCSHKDSPILTHYCPNCGASMRR